MQDQWLNIFLLTEFKLTFYSFLYFLSGLLFPILVIYNSLNNFNDYKLNHSKYKSKKLKSIGSLITCTALTLSILIISYLLFSLNYFTPQIDLNLYFDLKLKILLLLILIILLFINKAKGVIKKFILLNFFIVSFINWLNYFLNSNGIQIPINRYISNNSYYDFNNLSILNVFFLLIFEILYYLWSYLTYKNNISDWSINYPNKLDFVPISKISIFYLGVLIYYFIFNRIN